jgi:uncharacterized protein
MFDLFKKNSHITFDTLVIDGISISLPVCRIEGKKPGSVLLVTAGNDGDEYAGIDAAYSLIQHYSKGMFEGTLIILPIVNMPGFRAESSKNPHDGRYPKFLYPGSPSGSSTEQIRYWMSGYVFQAHFWLDLHGAALTEKITPFVYAWKSGDQHIDTRVLSMIQAMRVEKAVFAHTTWDRIVHLASKGCGYILTEAGSSETSHAQSVSLHIEWARVVMMKLGMIEDTSAVQYEKKIYSHVHEYTVNTEGIWRAGFSELSEVKKGDLIGIVSAFDGREIEKIYAKQHGCMLWGKTGLAAHKGDIVAAIAY